MKAHTRTHIHNTHEMEGTLTRTHARTHTHTHDKQTGIENKYTQE